MKLMVLNNILDKQQTKCAITNNINTIIIAGAGSGKSLTMVGKIKYLVNILNISINDILCITFTNDAAKSLENKINKELNLNTKVYTFHKLALEIIKEHNLTYTIADPNLLEYITNEIFLSLNNTYLHKLFKNNINIIPRFIHLYISNFNNFNLIIKKALKSDIPYLLIIKKILDIYTLEKQSQGLIDFDDMLQIATNLVLTNGINKIYKYIIIDEYQDTSKKEGALIKAIINKTNALITVVGDDFQSIYRFSGCDLANFLNFKKEFKPAKTLYLTTTYRNSNELIKVAGSFIMQNKRQIKKHLTSSKRLNKPLVILYYKNIKKDFLKALDYINQDNLMILGRNNNDIYDVLNPIYINNNIISYKYSNIYYKTIHKSKGLEEENVLIINLTNNINSLPSQIKEESLLKYVLIYKDLYPYEEERRLFYVALTRTKNYCYLYVNKNNPSIFIEELNKHYKKYISIINL